MIILDDIHSDDADDYLFYEWLRPLTQTDKQVIALNNKFNHLGWRFRKGGLKHYSGVQATGRQMRDLITL